MAEDINYDNVCMACVDDKNNRCLWCIDDNRVKDQGQNTLISLIWFVKQISLTCLM